MPNTPKPPPPWLVNGIGRAQAGLGQLRRSAIPATIAMLEIGFRVTDGLPTADPMSIVEARPA